MFRFNEEKFNSLLQLICDRCKEIDRLKAVKLFYYIDKQSLLNTGRPVLGDRYYKMTLVPVPSESYDMIKKFPFGDNGECKFFYTPTSNSTNPFIEAKHSPNLDVFSKKELESIEKVLKEHGHRSGKELSDLSHNDYAWTHSKSHSPIDYRLSFKDNPEESKHAFEAMLIEQEDEEFLDNF